MRTAAGRVSARLERLERRALLSAIPVGPELRANAYTTNFQADPAVAVDADGDLVVTWYSEGQDGDRRGVYAQVYDTSGAPVGGEFLVNEHTTGSQSNPAVAIDTDGDFVIAWQSENQDGAGWGVYARRFDETGAPLGGEFLVNTTTTANQQTPAVATDAAGNFVVVWELTQPQTRGIYARRYDASGAPLGGEFRATSTTGSAFQFAPAVAMSPAGAFVVAWSGGSSGVDGQGVFMRRFDATGAAQGSDALVNTFTTGEQYYPSVAMDADGDYVIAWDSKEQDGSGWGVYGQRFDETGAPQGGEFRANTLTTDYQQNAAVAMDADGNFVVTWTGYDAATSDYGIYAQRFDAAGAPVGGEFLGNAFTSNVQQSPAIASEADGDFVLAWESFGQDGSAMGVYAQRFAVAVEVTSSDFRFEMEPHELRFSFNTDVSASLGMNDLVVENLTTMQTVPSSDFTLAYDATTNVATFTYTGSAGGFAGVSADGNFTATLLASGITTPGGLTPRGDHEFDFFFLNGDANHDGRVNLSDFNVLAINFGQSNRTFTQGDFNYDGLVNLTDFNILSTRFGQELGAGRPNGRDLFDEIDGDTEVSR